MRVTRPLDDIFGNPNNVKLLRHLIRYPSTVITGRGLARELGMSHATCIRTLDRLVNIGILDRRRVGKSSTYQVAEDSVLYKKVLSPAFEVEAGLLGSLIDDLMRGIKGDVRSAYLFGSVARGEDTLSSDVDILVLVKDASTKIRVLKAIEGNKEAIYRLYRVGVTAIVYDHSEFERLKKRKNPLVVEILREGVLVAGKEVR